MIGLLARDRRLVEGAHLAVGLQRCERLAQRFGVLRGEQRALHAAAIAQMFQDFLADQLALAVAVGGDDHHLAGLQRRRDGLQLGGLVAAGGRPGGVEAVRLKQRAGPAFPGRIDLIGFGETEQVALSRQDLPVTAAERRRQIFRLAGFFGDDQRCHDPPRGMIPVAAA